MAKTKDGEMPKARKLSAVKQRVFTVRFQHNDGEICRNMQKEIEVKGCKYTQMDNIAKRRGDMREIKREKNKDKERKRGREKEKLVNENGA